MDRRLKFRLLASCASAVAITLGCVSAGAAQTVEGERQTASGADAVNLYEVESGAPPRTSGTTRSVTADGAAVALAIVTCAEFSTCPNPGAIEQSASGTESARNAILVGGAHAVQAVAQAHGSQASATALVRTAVSQLAQAPNEALNELSNSGTLEVLANAEAVAGSSHGTANSSIGAGILQVARATEAGGQANAGIENDGAIAISGIAAATGVHAGAYAQALAGIVQVASGETAAVSIENRADLAIGADARAVGALTAQAGAFVEFGMVQLATGAAAATASFDNGGNIDVSARAHASGEQAAAAARVGNALSQFAASLDLATASLDNQAAIGISASALAEGENSAAAEAVLGFGVVHQSAVAYGADGEAAVSIGNAGEIAAAASAQALAGDTASAIAIGGGILQQASGPSNGTHATLLDNSGAILLTADAEALAGESALAVAILSNAIVQDASDGTAQVALTNSGAMDFAASAHAEAANAAGVAEDAAALAAVGGVFQTAAAATLSVSAGATAGGGTEQKFHYYPTGPVSASLENSGNVDIAAQAGAAADGAAFASALAVGTGQLASGTDAQAAISNIGAMNYAASATAAGGSQAMAAALAGGVSQTVASYEVSGAKTLPGAGGAEINQHVTPTGSASGSLVNSGTIAVGAAASAAADGAAFAFVSAAGAAQRAIAAEASLTVQNDGEFGVHGTALASGASATAVAGASGVNQTATAISHHLRTAVAPGSGSAVFSGSDVPVGTAAVSLANTNSLEVGAKADAEGGLAAAATRGATIRQVAVAADAAALIENSGNVAADADAQAAGATAVASAVASGAGQLAVAMGTWTEIAVMATASGGTQFSATRLTTPVGSASASLVNSGSLEVAGAAGAEGGTFAQAGALALGVEQAAFGSDASALLGNDGAIAVDAVAAADATGATAVAVAAARGIVQVASAVAYATTVAGSNPGTGTVTMPPPGTTILAMNATTTSQTLAGRAALSLANSGTIGVSASAAAEAPIIAAVIAEAAGVVQQAVGTEASAAVANEGGIQIAAAAVALAGDGSSASAGAAAYVSTAIVQLAYGGGAEGTGAASFENSGTLTIAAGADAASGNTSAARAQIGSANFDSGPILQVASGPGGASADIGNSGDMLISLDAVAIATNDSDTAFGALASATAFGVVGQSAVAVVESQHSSSGSSGLVGTLSVTPTGGASASLANSGSLSAEAAASAIADGSGQAFAVLRGGVSQQAAGATALASIVNSGVIDFQAEAYGSAASNAFALGLVNGAGQAARATSIAVTSAFSPAGDYSRQSIATPVGAASASLANSGTINLSAVAHALAGSATDVGFDGAFAAGNAIVDGLRQYAAGMDASVRVENSGSIAISAESHASGHRAVASPGVLAAVSQGASAISLAGQSNFGAAGTALFGATSTPVGTASARLENSGTIELNSNGKAEGVAAFSVSIGLTAFQSVQGETALASIDNGGSVSADLTAVALGGTLALASALATGAEQVALAIAQSTTVGSSGGGPLSFGTTTGPTGTTGTTGTTSFGSTFSRTVQPVGEAAASLTNSGTFGMAVEAHAVATLAGTGTNAFAGARVDGVVQVVAGATALAAVHNQGSMGLTAAAQAEGESSANAFATVYGINQRADAVAVQQSSAAGNAGGHFFTGETPVGQASAAMTNSGSFDIGAAANALAGTGSIFASVSSIAVAQQARGVDASASVENEGSFTAAVTASAMGGDHGSADARLVAISQAVSALARGTTQFFGMTSQGGFFSSANSWSAAAGSASASLSNSGTMSLGVHSDGTGSNGATASAEASAVLQSVAGSGNLAEFGNSGEIGVAVVAEASATGETGSATAAATARGYALTASGGAGIDVSNSGALSASASAVAAGTTAPASALARALDLSAVAVGTDTVGAPGALTGAIGNSGEIRASAFASGVAGAGEQSSALVAASASAIGAVATAIRIGSGSNDLALTNSGVIEAVAHASEGGTAAATAILVAGNGSATPAEGDGLVITNDDGRISAAISADGGTTARWGTAINVVEAPNGATAINLLGNGVIYGHIDIAGNDTILVAGGETSFDGIVNPGQAGAAAYDGSLTIAGDGTLFLRNVVGSANGASKIYIGDFAMAQGAALALELGMAGAGSYPQIFAGTASVDGTLEIRPNFGGGLALYADEYDLQNVIDANALSGRFDGVSVSGAGALINAEITYDAQANVDLLIARTPFGQLGAETGNQASVGAGIENVYSTSLDGPFGALVAEIFTLDAPDYYAALDQLQGAHYAGYLHALRNSSATINRIVSEQADCTIRIAALSGCRAADENGRLWMTGGYNDAGLDADANAPGYDANTWFVLAGGDYAVGDFTFGGFGGYRDLELDPAIPGSEAEAKGMQLGLYGRYDAGNFYALGIGSWSDLDGRSRRAIGIGSIAGEIVGDPDASIWSFYGEAGVRIAFGQSWLTPFAAVDHTNVELKSFTETGVPGANLDFDAQDTSRTSLIAGLGWSGNWGGIAPEVKVAYRHDFGDRVFHFDARFADAPAGSDFRIVSPRSGRGSILADLSLAGNLADNVTGRFGYKGRFGGGVEDHAVFGSLIVRFGGGALPPPSQ